MIGFFDTESTAFVNPNKGPEDPQQGRVIQAALVITDSDGNEAGSFSTILEAPTGIIFNPHATKIHGITPDFCAHFGVSRALFLQTYGALLNKCEMVVAHNFSFDSSIMNVESACHDFDWEPKKSFCTMKETTAFCKLKKTNGSPKWPKLQELHKILFGEEFEGGHDALADTRAMVRCFFELRKRDIISV